MEADPVGNAAEALSHIATGSYRLFVTDGVVRDGSVSNVIERFRTKNPGAPIIVCSGHIENSVILDGIERKDARFLEKPFSAEAFIGVIEEALGSTD
jgi:DNA-binding NtrC family response regulator